MSGEPMMFIGRRYVLNVAFGKGVADRSSSATPLRRVVQLQGCMSSGRGLIAKPSRTHATTKRCAKPCSNRVGGQTTKRIDRQNGRSERIRTSGPCVPNTVLYQAELHSDTRNRAVSPVGNFWARGYIQSPPARSKPCRLARPRRGPCLKNPVYSVVSGSHQT